ncbi:Ring finger domain [Carpediemonas membranifera]|uniref:Ring finger domain n=1 Tax=Carpediemonas membranifera TaxID=201153 RepID=A0A8J6DYL0_9EUKA|nr:Ring finger domain [Carpediemonas membranifera]|eukprot:KAG9389483.1 Ring finger domain [Carpediemonas membranifera]
MGMNVMNRSRVVQTGPYPANPQPRRVEVPNQPTWVGRGRTLAQWESNRPRSSGSPGGAEPLVQDHRLAMPTSQNNTPSQQGSANVFETPDSRETPSTTTLNPNHTQSTPVQTNTGQQGQAASQTYERWDDEQVYRDVEDLLRAPARSTPARQPNQRRRRRDVFMDSVRPVITSPEFISSVTRLTQGVLEGASAALFGPGSVSAEGGIFSDFMPMLSEQFLERVPVPVPQNELELIPVVSFRPGMFASDPTCAICRADYTYNENIRVLPCGHHMHQRCVDVWFETRNTCPMCRERVAACIEQGVDDVD